MCVCVCELTPSRSKTGKKKDKCWCINPYQIVITRFYSCPSEGIDDLAAYLGKGEEVARFTAKAMTGTIPFEEALAERLKIIQPSLGDIETFLAEHPPLLSPGVKELVDALHLKGKRVYLVSGGFRLMIEPVAEQLKIPKENIFANTILFSEDSSKGYQGFDASEFTSRAGGKAKAAKHIKVSIYVRTFEDFREIFLIISFGFSGLRPLTHKGKAFVLKSDVCVSWVSS